MGERGVDTKAGSGGGGTRGAAAIDPADRRPEVTGGNPPLVIDRAAARRWLVRLVAARAVELHRERHRPRPQEAPPPGA